MITNKILWIEIALVVITTVRHTSANNRIQLCYNLIQEVKVFNPGERMGFSNFRNAYRHLRTEDIRNKVDELDNIPGNFENATMRGVQKELTINYSLYLLNGISLELYFDDPDAWCRDKIEGYYKEGKIIDLETPLENEVEICKATIFEHMCIDQDFANDKFHVLKALYENMSYGLLKKMLPESHYSFNVLNYVLNYFNYVAEYVYDKGHIEHFWQFKSVMEFCTEEGYKLLPSEN